MWLAFLAASFATVPEKYGSGAASMALGGTGVAWADDGHAAWYNPAGLSRMRRPSAGIGFSGAWEHLAPTPGVWWDTNRDGGIDARDPPLVMPSNIDDAVGIHLQAGRHLGGKFGVGLTAYFPTRRVLELRTIEPDLPQYFLYGSRLQRYVLAAGVGGQITKGVHVGAGVDFVPRVQVDLALSASANVQGGADTTQDVVSQVVIDVHELDLEIIAGFAPTLGLQVDMGAFSAPLTGLTLGLAWHGALGLPVTSTLDAQVNLSVEDIGDLEPYLLAVVAQAGVNLFDHYVPMTLTGGAAWRREGHPGVAIDVKWTDWRPMLLSVAQLDTATVASPLLRLDDGVVDGNPVEAVFRATVGVRTGVEVPLPTLTVDRRWRYLKTTLRVGGGYEPTPLVSQGASSSLLDANRALATLGVGFETWDPSALVDAPVWMDLHVGYHALLPDTLVRVSAEPRSGYPVSASTIPIGGHVVVAGMEWGFQF